MSALTGLLATVKSAAEGVAGLAVGRVFQGRKVYAEGDTTLEDAIRDLTPHTEGVFAFWLGQRQIPDRMKPGQVTVQGQLFVQRPKDATDDMSTEYDFVELLAKALSDLTTFSTTRSLNVVWECGDDGLEDSVAVYDFEMTYQVSAC